MSKLGTLSKLIDDINKKLVIEYVNDVWSGYVAEINSGERIISQVGDNPNALVDQITGLVLELIGTRN